MMATITAETTDRDSMTIETIEIRWIIKTTQIADTTTAIDMMAATFEITTLLHSGSSIIIE